MDRLALRSIGYALVLSLAAGCGGATDTGRPKVQGQLSYRGKPVADKTLILEFDAPVGESFSQMLPLSSDGRFGGEVPRPGTYKVVIAESLAVMERREPRPANAVPLPAKYKSAAVSDLSWEITRGQTNVRDLVLTD